MKLDVWVSIGQVRQDSFFESRCVTVDVPPPGELDMQAVVFELPLNTRLDGRGPIRVMLEHRPDPPEAIR